MADPLPQLGYSGPAFEGETDRAGRTRVFRGNHEGDAPAPHPDLALVMQRLEDLGARVAEIEDRLAELEDHVPPDS